MQNVVVFVLIFSFTVGAQASGSSLRHLEKIKARHPLALLGDDFEVLNAADLAINACWARPQPFRPGSTYLYWQCFSSKDLSFECDPGFEKDELGRAQALAVVVVRANKKQEYLARRPWAMGVCKDLIAGMRRLVKGTRHTCLSGEFIDDAPDGDGKTRSSWIFDRLKTQKGCESYFHGGCSLSYQKRISGCRP